MSDTLVMCETHGTCSEHGPYVWFCKQCHDRWAAAHPLTVAAIDMMADPAVSYSKARTALQAARRAEDPS